ncbi:MAG: TIM-barrel domain-containing protein [Planctomycetota bacterium]
MPASEACVGGLDGVVTSLCTALPFDGVSAVQERFTAAASGIEAVRYRIVNQSGDAVTIGRMRSRSDRVTTSRASVEWQVTRMARQKNDIPGNYRPGVDDADQRHAWVDSAEFRAGAGVVSGGVQDRPDRPVQSDPLVWIGAGEDRGQAFAILGQTNHLSQIEVTPQLDRDGTAQALVVDAYHEFDETQTPARSSRTSHWVLAWPRVTRDEAIRSFAEALDYEIGSFRRSAPPQSPTMICSWYFYGREFTEDDLHADMAAYRAEPFPSDVFLIDNCWMDSFGSWEAGSRFPSGMPQAAECIRRAGLEPGILTAPFVVASDAEILEQHPELIARTADGEPCVFPYSDPGLSVDFWVIDPTAPAAEDYFKTLYSKLNAWGYRYHKLDFLRANISNPQIRFYDRSATRAQAYRRGMELVEQAIGPEGYILACGGLYEASLGLVDAQRVGSDVKGRWYEPDPEQPGYITRIKQSVCRAWTRRWWHTDPDALQLRRRSEPFRGLDEFAHLSEGRFNDEEAFSTVVNQYLAGGIVCLSERIEEFDTDRKHLLRYVVPSLDSPGQPLDWEHPLCPTLFLTRVKPRAESLDSWWTLTVANWGDDPVTRQIDLAKIPDLAGLKRVAVFEIAEQEFCGEFQLSDVFKVAIPAHGCRVLRIAPSAGRDWVLLGTDLHLSGGGVEIDHLIREESWLDGSIDSPWRLPVAVSLGVRLRGHLTLIRHTVEHDQPQFKIGLSDLTT